MIYLTDVGENDGPLEILVNKDGKALKLKSNRINKEDFNSKKWDDPRYFKGQYNGNRISEQDIEDLLKLGYKKKKITGKKGTIILFSENIIHRANYCKENHRNVINTVICPSLYKNINYFNRNNLTIEYSKWLD